MWVQSIMVFLFYDSRLSIFYVDVSQIFFLCLRRPLKIFYYDFLKMKLMNLLFLIHSTSTLLTKQSLCKQNSPVMQRSFLMSRWISSEIFKYKAHNIFLNVHVLGKLRAYLSASFGDYNLCYNKVYICIKDNVIHRPS